MMELILFKPGQLILMEFVFPLIQEVGLFFYFRKWHYESQKGMFLNVPVRNTESPCPQRCNMILPKERLCSMTYLHSNDLSNISESCDEGNKFSCFEKQCFEWIKVNILMLILSLRPNWSRCVCDCFLQWDAVSSLILFL